MSAKTLTVAEAKAANFIIIENRKGTQAVHDAVIAMQANRRSGTACTKTKAEVSYSGSKPWKQKGTGRARAGYASSPVWRGGGVVFGPKPRDYTIQLPKKVKRLAFRKALSERILNGDILVVETFSVPSGKTSDFVAQIASLIGEETKFAVVSGSLDEVTLRSARNHGASKLIRPSDLNTEEVLYYRKLIVTADALPLLAERTAA